jgi:tetratricopeptide (TPR) repeat protein
MIPFLLTAVIATSCTREETSQESQISVEQRRAAINSAMEHIDANRVDEAMAIASTLVRKDSSSSQTQETYGIVLLAQSFKYEELGDIKSAIATRKKALQAYIEACKHSSSPGLLHLSTAQLAQDVNDLTTARTYYKLAHDNNTNDGRAAFFLTQLHLLEKEWDQAKHWARESLNRNPNEPYTLLSASLAEAELGNCLEANALSTKGCTINPNDSNLRLMQARVLRLCGNPIQALEILSGLPEAMQETDIVEDEKGLCLIEIEGSNQ